MFVRTLLLLSFFVSVCARVQAQNGLENASQAVANHLGTVKIAKGQYTQQIATSKIPQRMTFTVILTDAKGKTNDENYTLNVADLDPASISFRPIRDVMTITASTKLSRSFIRYSENGQPGSFTNKMTLYAENPADAQALIESLRKLAVEAEKSYQPTKLPDDYDGLVRWLKNNISSVTIGTSGFEQSLNSNDDNALLVNFQQNKEGKGDELLTFNAADLNQGELKITASGKYLSLAVVTRNRDRLIRAVRTGKLGELRNDFEIISTDPDLLRSIEAAWRKLIPLAEKKLESQRPAMQSMADIQKVINAGVRAVTGARDNVNQQITLECECVLTQSWANRSSPTEDTYRFSMDDLAENKTKITTSNGLFALSLNTGARNLIKVTKNQALQNYTSDIDIMSYDLEAIRFLPQAFNKAAQLCRQARKSPVPTKTALATLNWLSEQMPSVRRDDEEVKATLEAVEDGNVCLLRFTERSTGRKISETQYEIPLKFLNVGGVEMTVSGRSIYVSLPTNGRERMVKSVKDGKPADYVSIVRIQFDEIEKARYVADAFRHLIRQCTANN